MAKTNRKEQKKGTKKRKEDAIEAYKVNRYNISKTCKSIGMGRTAFYDWIKNDPDFAQAIEDAKESLIDEVEDILLKKIRGFEHTIKREKVDKEGNVIVYNNTFYFPPCYASLKLFLDAQARHRGFGMKQDDSDSDQNKDDE